MALVTSHCSQGNFNRKTIQAVQRMASSVDFNLFTDVSGVVDAERVGDLTTWTALRQDGPKHLGLC